MILYHLIILPTTGSGIFLRTNYRFPPTLFPIVLKGIPYFIPSIICLVCCIIQTMSLRRTADVGNTDSHRKNKITITILQITVVFFMCNTTYFLTTYCLVTIYNPRRLRENALTIYILGNTFHFLNALISPIILITRGKALAMFVKNKLNESPVYSSLVQQRSPGYDNVALTQN